MTKINKPCTTQWTWWLKDYCNDNSYKGYVFFFIFWKCFSDSMHFLVFRMLWAIFTQLFQCSFDLSSASANIYAQTASNDRCNTQRNYDSEMQLNTALKALLAWLDVSKQVGVILGQRLHQLCTYCKSLSSGCFIWEWSIDWYGKGID